MKARKMFAHDERRQYTERVTETDPAIKSASDPQTGTELGDKPEAAPELTQAPQ